MLSALRQHQPPPDDLKAISTETFSSLINLAGRQRMLSQRIILNTMLSSLGHEDALDIAQEALTLFASTHADLVEGNKHLPGIFSPALEQAYFGENNADATIRRFIQDARQALQITDEAHTLSQVQLDRLGKYATPLVTLLNQITQIYEAEARQHATQHKKQQQELMENIQQITKQAKIVSVNAKIIAARAGNAGREFSVVAGVLANITNELDELIFKAVKNSGY
ncbi:hypothetical protein LG202_02040 [Methylobacillus methanolivorans]